MSGQPPAAPAAWRVRESAPPIIGADGLDQSQPTVIVVGAGPTGLTIAAGLTRAGVRTLVLEADNTVCRSSRANAISERTFEVINRVAPGLAQRLIADSVPMLGGDSYFGHRLLARQVTPTKEVTGGQYPPTSYLSQWNIEDGLLAELATRTNSEVRWNNAVADITSDELGVELTVDAPGGQYRVRAPWVVAADGGRSLIRRQLGLRMSGLAYEVTFIVVDAVISGEQPPPVRKVWFDPAYLPGGLVLRHMPPEGFWRIDFQLPIGSDIAAAVEPDNILRLIRAHLADIGHDGDVVQIADIGTYKTRAVVLDDLRVGRVIFAGDAAHLVPIFGGFGLNSGVDDADNLQWKLALVAAGLAPDTLLDSYSAERVPVLRQTLGFVARSTEYMTPTSAQSEQLRQAALTLAAQGDVLAASLGRHRAFRSFPYEAATIASDDDDFSAGPTPGARIERGWVTTNGHAAYLPELIGGALTILVVTDAASSARALLDTATAARTAADSNARVVRLHTGEAANPNSVDPADELTRLEDPDGSVVAGLDASGGAIYLVRPDCVVAARWRRPDVDALAQTLRAAIGLTAAIPAAIPS